MKHLSEYRDPAAARTLGARIRGRVTRPWTIMEICGGQTHTIVRSGLEELLPREITLVHGPGCPVCVTPAEIIDRAVELALTPGVTLCSFGDMLRVPGNGPSLLDAKARGGDVRILYNPVDALEIARRSPERQVIFLAIGFETTAPAHAMAAWQAMEEGIENFSLLVSHVLVPPAMEAILSAPGCRINGFLAAGHVCTVMGTREYVPLARRYSVPIVVTGFEPVDLLQGILMATEQLESGRAEVENQYARAVRPEGNVHARKLIEEVFEVAPQRWRGIGEIPRSGLMLRGRYAALNAERRFPSRTPAPPEAAGAAECIAGLVLQGLRKPHECPSFGTACTPDSPLGAPMVSSEGACAAYYQYGRHRKL